MFIGNEMDYWDGQRECIEMVSPTCPPVGELAQAQIKGTAAQETYRKRMYVGDD